MNDIQRAYFTMFHHQLLPHSYGFSSGLELLTSMDDMLEIKKMAAGHVIHLKAAPAHEVPPRMRRQQQQQQAYSSSTSRLSNAASSSISDESQRTLTAKTPMMASRANSGDASSLVKPLMSLQSAVSRDVSVAAPIVEKTGIPMKIERNIQKVQLSIVGCGTTQSYASYTLVVQVYG